MLLKRELFFACIWNYIIDSIIEQYRYDAFGGLYAGVTAPYNTVSFAGQTYDSKANLVDMHARWYAPQSGRFITPDSYRGDLSVPDTQNRYAYAGDNPINRWDPTGYLFETYSTSEITRDWYESSYSSNRYEGSDGWYTSWSSAIYHYKELTVKWYVVLPPPMNEYNYDTEVSQFLDSMTVESGTNFQPFSPNEWYNKHKDTLKSFGSTPENVYKFEYNKWTYSYNKLSSVEQTLLKTTDADINKGILKSKEQLIQSQLASVLKTDLSGADNDSVESRTQVFQDIYGLKETGVVDQKTFTYLQYAYKYGKELPHNKEIKGGNGNWKYLPNTQGTGNSILSELERFLREPITSTWGISDDAIEKWYLSHSNVKSKNAKYNLNAGNIREVTNAVRDAGVSPVLFYIYSVNEGSGGNIAGGFINHWTPKNVDTTNLPVSSAIQDAKYLVKQSKNTNDSPATGGGEPADMPTAAASKLLKSLPAGSIGIVYILSTSACTAEINDLNGITGDWTGLYGNPLQTLMNCVKELGGKF